MSINVGNGYTMLKELHQLFHNIYGQRNTNIEQLIEFKNRFL